MRRCIDLGLRQLESTNVKGFVGMYLPNARFFTSMGVSAKYMLKESDVSEHAKRLFDEIRILEKTSLKSYDSVTGLEVLELVDKGCLLPNRSLYNTLLKKCAELGNLKEGRIVHAHALNSVVKDDIVIHNNIILMYAKCGSLVEAQNLFEGMPFKDVATWTSMIIACSQNDRAEEALLLFPQMLRFGLKPNAFTFSSVLKASGAVLSDKHGMHIHACCIKYGYESDTYVGSSLLHMYARSGHMDKAEMIFDRLSTKNNVSWNALIAGYVRKGEGEKALNMLQRMKREDFEANEFTYSSILNACASTGALEQGKWLHTLVIKSGEKLIDFVGHTLLHMYAKSGSIEDAEKVFARLVKKDVVSWNSMLSGYAQHGLGGKALQQLHNMLETGIPPNAITFLCVLTVCSHAALVEQGQFFLNMMKRYGLEPNIEHCVAVVDLLSRAGKLDQALRFIREMSIKPTAEVWKALLGACSMHKNLELGAYAAERVFELDPHDCGPYVILSNMYASAGRRIDCAKVRKMMKARGVRKEPACSWMEIENVVHMFIADDDTNPQSKEIYKMLEDISTKIKEVDYLLDTSPVVDEH